MQSNCIAMLLNFVTEIASATVTGKSRFTRSTNMWKLLETKKFIEIDPNCSRPYSYLGFGYFAQGKYRDAIDKGLTKALQLDPDSARLAEYLQVAEERLGDVHRTNQNQNGWITARMQQ